MTTLKNKCRLCLNENPSINIFSGGFSLLSKIKTCCGIQIHNSDGLPENICRKCHNKLNVAFNFKLKCVANDLLLRKQLHILFKPELENDPIEGIDSIAQNESPCESFDSNDEIKSWCNVDIKEEPFKLNIPISKKDENTKILTKCNKRKRKTLSVKKSIVIKKECKTQKSCPVCGIVVKTNYYKHVRCHDNDDLFGIYTCDVCNKNFKRKVNLITHILTHNKTPCGLCEKSFASRSIAKKHRARVHNKSRLYMCSVCGKGFFDHFSLKTHSVTHTGEKSFVCDICKQTFGLKTTLTHHMRIHMGIKPYQCQYCNHTFRLQGTYREHVRLHTGETPYVCPLCSKGFAQLSNLKSHFKNNHKGTEFYDVYERRRPGRM